jgi:hypothetical protein
LENLLTMATKEQRLLAKLSGIHIECAEPIECGASQRSAVLALHVCQHEVLSAIYRLFEKIPDDRIDYVVDTLERWLQEAGR